MNQLKCVISFSRRPVGAFTITHYIDGDINDIFEKVNIISDLKQSSNRGHVYQSLSLNLGSI